MGVTMKLLLLFLAAFAVPSSSLSCLPQCVKGQDTESSGCVNCLTVREEDCSSGEVTTGPCGCPECAKAVGESCGGTEWGLDGTCAAKLTCAVPKDDQTKGMGYSGGVCCCEKKTVGGIPYTLVGSGDTRGLGCLNGCIYKANSGGEVCFRPGALEVDCNNVSKGTGQCQC